LTEIRALQTRPARISAAATSAGLSLLFVAVYGTCNWITAQRSDVGTWYYGWERHIPFVPLMIVPYLSIDLLFVAAPFLCQTREERRVLVHRIVFAILVCGGFFLAMPLQFGLSVPQPKGWTGALFTLLHGFDRPTNLFPSLHITLRTILAQHYARHTKGAVRAANAVWFSLIGFSTLLTYQHHIVDIIGGFVLAGISFYLLRENSSRLPVIANLRIGVYYALGALGAIVLAIAGWPWMGLLLWPAIAMGMVAMAYAGLGPAIYRKANGCVPFSSRLLLAPCLAGQYLSLRHYRRQCDAWNELTPRLWMGAKLSRREAEEIKRRGATAVLDLTAEFSETPPLLDLDYRNIQILDLTGLNLAQLRDAVDFVTRHSATGVVYIHCKVGYSRTAAVAGACLIAAGDAANAGQAVARLREVRPTIIIRPEARAALEAFSAAFAAEKEILKTQISG
jgi:predicted protein tyrosine phosphatase/membrane-associated phospholipid phosphatase